MAKSNQLYLAFNRGIVSALGLARIDVEKLAMMAETMVNWMPRVLGSMMLRPGMEYIGSTLSDAKARLLPFIFSVDDTAQIEMTATAMRVRIDDVLLTRPTVTAAITNGGFIGNLNDWTDADEAGAASAYVATNKMGLLGNGTNAAIRRQTLAINEVGTLHAVRIDIDRGPVQFRIGSTSGGEELFTEAALETGEHSLSFTPTGANAYIEFSSILTYTVLVDSIAVEAAGTVSLTTPYAEADLKNIRYDQSGDVIFVGCEDHVQKKMLRFDANSWSIVDYLPVDGPFETLNVSQTTITPSALSGDVTLTASRGIFKSSHVGALFSISSLGQKVQSSISSADSFSDPIKVIGIGNQRIFNIAITGTFVATITVQYSVGSIGSWADLATTYTAPATGSHDDDSDEQIIYYRIGIKAGQYTSGTAVCSLTYAAGSITGVARVTAFTTVSVVDAVVLKDFGGVVASADWREGSWGTRLGYPNSVRIFENRVWWAGRDRIWGSVSDGYESFDDSFTGSSGTIARNIGSGPIQCIHWMMALGRLIIGTAQNSSNVDTVTLDGNNPLSARSSSFDAPLTPSNFNLKILSSRGVFVDRSQQRLYSLQYDTSVRSIGADDYIPEDLSVLAPDLNESGITHIAAQMKPDIRIHCVRNDGKVGVFVFDRAEDVTCWVEVETDGEIEDVCILPGTVEDQVYYVVKRTIDGNTVRYIEKWSLESECQGGLLNKQADSFVYYDGASTTTMSGLDHLEGETVVVWADGIDVGTKVVSSGVIGLSTAASKIVAGLPYTAQFKGSKLANATGVGLNVTRIVTQIGVVLHNTHYQGLQYGPDFDNLSELPLVTGGLEQDEDAIYSHYDEDTFPFGGSWNTDSRVCLQAAAPRPCTVLASVAEIEAH
jgi:hypothetical protein